MSEGIANMSYVVLMASGEQVNIRRHRKHELCKRVTLSKNVPRMFDTCKVPIITVFESCTEMESK